MDKTNYFTVEVYAGQAPACAKDLGKGSRVVVDAELDWREWTDQQDNKREAVTLRAPQVLFAGGRFAPRRCQRGASTTVPRRRPGESAPGASMPGAAGEASANDVPF